MTAVRHLRRAPITEALIDLRVKARPDADAKEFGAALEGLQDFPILEEQRRTELTVAAGTDRTPRQDVSERAARTDKPSDCGEIRRPA